MTDKKHWKATVSLDMEQLLSDEPVEDRGKNKHVVDVLEDRLNETGALRISGGPPGGFAVCITGSTRQEAEQSLTALGEIDVVTDVLVEKERDCTENHDSQDWALRQKLTSWPYWI